MKRKMFTENEKKNKIGATSTKVKFLKKLYLKIDRLVYKKQMCHLLHF